MIAPRFTLNHACKFSSDKKILIKLLPIVKEGLQSVLRIGSAHNKGGPPNINIV